MSSVCLADSPGPTSLRRQEWALAESARSAPPHHIGRLDIAMDDGGGEPVHINENSQELAGQCAGGDLVEAIAALQRLRKRVSVNEFVD